MGLKISMTAQLHHITTLEILKRIALCFDMHVFALRMRKLNTVRIATQWSWSLNMYCWVCHMPLQCVKSLFLWGCVSVGVTIKSIYCAGDYKARKNHRYRWTNRFNEVGLHLAASHHPSLHPCHSAKAVPCQHARPYEHSCNLHTYKNESCLLCDII